jgi:hypothetical protein
LKFQTLIFKKEGIFEIGDWEDVKEMKRCVLLRGSDALVPL